MWNVESGKCLGRVAEGENITFLKVAAADGAILVGDKSNVRVYDMNNYRGSAFHLLSSWPKETLGDTYSYRNYTLVALRGTRMSMTHMTTTYSISLYRISRGVVRDPT